MSDWSADVGMGREGAGLIMNRCGGRPGDRGCAKLSEEEARVCGK